MWKNVSGIWEQVGQDMDGDSDNMGFGYSVAIVNKGDAIGIGSSSDPAYAGEPLVRVFKSTILQAQGELQTQLPISSECRLLCQRKNLYRGKGKAKRNCRTLRFNR